MHLPALLAVLLGVAHTSLANPGSPFPSINLTSTIPISLFDLPALLPLPLHPDLAASELIRTTLGHYPLSIDGKNFGAFALVFAADAVANYSAPLDVLTPLAIIQAKTASSLQKVTTQHALSTQVIKVLNEEPPHTSSLRRMWMVVRWRWCESVQQQITCAGGMDSRGGLNSRPFSLSIGSSAAHFKCAEDGVLRILYVGFNIIIEVS
ncbi:hypothetical protein B0H19DRAFT_1065196 [Mycena capillaripes]|nr:hypothetical protein B0H19DRAFT_1065196 [Mycena capillaripes]